MDDCDVLHSYLGHVCGRDPGLDAGNFHALIKKVSESLKDLVLFLNIIILSL